MTLAPFPQGYEMGAPWYSTGLLLAALPFTLFAQQSSMFRGGPSHLGVYDGPGVPSFSRVQWKARIGGQIFSSAAVSEGAAYVGSTNGGLYAVDTKTGVIKWRFGTEARVNSSPAVADGLVFFSSYDGNIYAVESATGKERWRFTTGGERRFAGTHLHGAIPKGELMPDPYDMFLSSPAVVDGVVYLGSGDGSVYAIDAVSGTLRWRFKTGDVVHASPAVANGVVYIGSWDSWFYALDAHSGTVMWRFKTGEDPDIHNQQGISSSAAVVDGMVYFGARDGHLYAVDAVNGTRKWSFFTGGAWVTSSPAVYQGTVYFGTGSNFELRALNAATGKEVFMFQFDRGIFSSAAIAGGMLFIGGLDGKVTGFSLATGKPVWVFQTPEAASASAAYLAASKVAAQDTTNADRPFYDNMVMRFHNSLTGSMMASPVIVDDVIYIGSVDGFLYALR